jgi:hypothetical protein
MIRELRTIHINLIPEGGTMSANAPVGQGRFVDLQILIEPDGLDKQEKSHAHQR